MNLYIEIENEQPKNHPAFEDNLLQAFGEIPDHWEPFVRVELPVPGMYQTVDLQNSFYAKVDGVWKDVWTVRDMTQPEREAFDEATKEIRLAEQKSAKDLWDSLPNRDNFTAWTFDETSNSYQPPIPRPEPVDGKVVRWCGADNSWKEAPDRPSDGGDYVFNYTNWTWEVL